MDRYIFYALMVLLTTQVGCMGIPLPFTDYRLGKLEVNISHNATNSACTDLDTLTTVAKELEGRHQSFIRSRDYVDAIHVAVFKFSLGASCVSRMTKLNTGEIKTELFGDISIIPDPDKLRELGGFSFIYIDTMTRGGIAPSLHLQKRSQGPERKMVAVYQLSDGKIIHFNYSGTDNVDVKSRSWPLDQFFGVAVGAAGKAVIP